MRGHWEREGGVSSGQRGPEEGLTGAALTCCPHGHRRFVCRACQVPEPEERFAVDEYSDMVALAKPVVYVTVGELVNTHRVRGRRRLAGRLGGSREEGRPADQLPPSCALQLLLEHQDHVAPDPCDPLHELLEDLGELPAVPDLVGACRPRAHCPPSVQSGVGARKLVPHSASLSLWPGHGHMDTD